MKIGVDACCWGNKRGFGRFTRELLESLLEIDAENDYLFFTDSETSEKIPENVKRIFVRTDFSAMKAASADGRRSLKDVSAMSRAVFQHQIDVFFFPAVYSYFPIFNRAKIVVTVHDMIADHHPELIFPNRKSKFFWKLKQNAAIRQADLILTVSEHSKREIGNYFHLPKSRLRVVNEAARAVFKVLPKDERTDKTLVHCGLKPDENFLLYVGGISPHKNLNCLIDAFKKVVNRNDEKIKLVLVGDYKDDPFFSAYPSLKKQIAELKLDDKVIFTGFVADEDLAQLYNCCEMLVFPSLEEGFGLPAIEAMACGAAVAASNCGSLPEVLGTVGAFFDPRSPNDIASAIEGILTDDNLRSAMRQASLQRVEEFQWTKAAADTLKIFDELNGLQSDKTITSRETLADFRHS